jgi:hypothetical protein
MTGVAEQIIKSIGQAAEGAVWSARGFLHLGSRSAVDQALSRLARAGHLLRVGRGLYVRPITTRFGMRAPAPEKVVEGVAALTGETVVPSGAAAANALGLSTQIPVRPVFLTSGRTRRIHLGRQVVQLQHAPAWQLRAPRSVAGQAMRALVWLGPERASEAAKILKAKLPEAERQALVAARAGLPTWLAQAVGQEMMPRG